MPFPRETLPALVDQTRNDIESRIPGADARLRRNMLDTDAAVWGAGLDGVYGKVQTLSKQAFAPTARGIFLDKHGDLIDVPRKLAQPATGTGTVPGTNSLIMPARTYLQRGDGAIFITTADAAASGNSATVRIAATIAGSAGNTPAGTALTVVNPVEGFSSTVTVTGDGLDLGFDTELDPAYLGRIELWWQRQPQGGATWDYVLRALSVGGVTRAWVFPNWMGIGSTYVSFVMDEQAGSILPGDDALAAVLASITDPTFRPPIGDIGVFAPTFAVCDFTIKQDPVSADLQAAITAALDALFLQEQSVGGAYLLPDGTATAGIIPIGKMWQAIESVTGQNAESDLISPTATFAAGLGQLPQRGAITWTS